MKMCTTYCYSYIHICTVPEFNLHPFTYIFNTSDSLSNRTCLWERVMVKVVVKFLLFVSLFSVLLCVACSFFSCSVSFLFPCFCIPFHPAFLLHSLLFGAPAVSHLSILLHSILTFLLFAAFLVSQYQVQWVTVIGLVSVAQALPLYKADLISCTLPLWG